MTRSERLEALKRFCARTDVMPWQEFYDTLRIEVPWLLSEAERLEKALRDVRDVQCGAECMDIAEELVGPAALEDP